MASPTTVREYIVVSATTIGALQTAVLNRMNTGFHCQGGLAIGQSLIGGSATYYQAMIRFTFV